MLNTGSQWRMSELLLCFLLPFLS
uniref:Uncharacterized protein n=1 Tax=Rhizophora mucronata TaxID=61149 RepID=A0A2P2R4T5_RHIMU